MSRGLPGTTVPVSHEPLFRLMVLATLSCSQPRGQADGRARSQSLPALTRLPEHLSPGTAALQIGRAHHCTPGTNAQLVSRLLLEKKNYFTILMSNTD